MKEYMLIGEAAKLLGISQQTLRKWETTRKLLPVGILKKTGYRLYRQDQLEKFKNKENKGTR
jgi:DNA-binding transcriptional MerR regulator